MIKVGQIYSSPTGICVVTKTITLTGTPNLLYQDGTMWEQGMLSPYSDKLIAEYETWQEAVVSKEFNGEDSKFSEMQKTLISIAKQNTGTELREDDHYEADFEGGHDLIVQEARNCLEKVGVEWKPTLKLK